MRVYLAPPGVLCCAGLNRTRFFEAALEGSQAGMVPVTLPGNRSFFAGRIAEELPEPAQEKSAEPAVYTRNTRLIRLASGALEQIRETIAQALAWYGADRVGVCVGSCDNGSEGSLLAHKTYLGDKQFPGDYELRFQSAGYIAEWISRQFGLGGPAVTVSTACASSAGALIRGAELIRGGLCDAVLAGGADLVSPTVFLGFHSLETLAEGITNPFSRNRRGITLGEGASFFVLFRDPVDPGIVLLGAGEQSDAFHITAPRSDGAGAIQAMSRALAQAGIAPESVDYLNLHGTGTRLNDQMEARAVAAVFPQYPQGPLVSSTKPITGHTLGAAGALELALCWMVLASGKPRVPVHRWDGEYDENLPKLRFADPGTSAERLGICMSNSFAFGGCNVSLVIGKVGKQEAARGA